MPNIHGAVARGVPNPLAFTAFELAKRPRHVRHVSAVVFGHVGTAFARVPEKRFDRRLLPFTMVMIR